MAEIDRVRNFERIEELVKSGAIDKFPIAEVKKVRDSLLRDSPTSNNPQFTQRWARVDAALAARIAADLAWWQKPWGLIAIGVASAVVGAAAMKLLGLG